MAKFWTEPLDRKLGNRGYGSPENTDKLDKLQRDLIVIYKVAVCGFEFEFADLDQIDEYIEYFAKKTHPSSRIPIDGDHWEMQDEFDKLPMRLLDNHNRPKVLKALTDAREFFRRGE